MADSRGNKFVCKFCNTSFACGKSLGGHIRIHKNGKQARVNQREKTSIVKLQISKDRRRIKKDSESEDTYRNSGNPRIPQKYSDSRFTLNGHLARHYQNEGKARKLEDDGSDSTESVFSSQEKVRNAALCLMTMSRDSSFPGFGDLNSVAESSRHRRENVASASNSNGGSEMKEAKRRKLEVAEPENFPIEACKKVKLKVPINGFVTNGEYKNSEVKYGFSIGSSNAESLKTSMKNEESDQVQTPSYKYELRKRSFNGSESTTHQYSGENSINTALNSNTTPAKELMESSSSKARANRDVSGNEEKQMGPKRKHKCPICFKVFKSGQALGGHKRSHVVGSSEDASMAMKQESSRVTGLLDLNAPAPMEEEEEEEISLWKQ